MSQRPDAVRMVLLCHTVTRTETNRGLSTASGEDGGGREGNVDALGREPAAHSSSDHCRIKLEQTCRYGRWL